MRHAVTVAGQRQESTVLVYKKNLSTDSLVTVIR